MAEAIVGIVLEAIGNLLIEEVKSIHRVSDQAEQLQLELKQMQSFLRDADAKQHDEETVKEWISQARNMAYAAEDLLESCAFKVGIWRGQKHTIGADFQILMTKISDLTKRFEEYGIRAAMERQDGSSSLDQQLRRTYSHVIEDHFVGLTSDVELLAEKLLMESDIRHFRVVSISGMGGLGKSTLARKVYNCVKEKDYFDGFAWICISYNWHVEEILKQILISVNPENRKEILKLRNEELVRQLFQLQQNKRYLVVLDDIWSADAWESIKQSFPIRKNGSKILLTTRNKDVALQIDANGFHHQPRFLSDDESWELLQMNALRERCEEDHEDNQKFEMLGEKMAKTCGGLPLAVVVLGGILRTKKSLTEWERVNKNIKVHIGSGRGNNLSQKQGNVAKILALSYHDLPLKLKPCFLYLSKFDEDSEIDAETLYQLWIAEGLISIGDRAGEESMMDVAERYLGELVQRCMVQGKASETPSFLRSFESCRLHDLMRDLSLLKAKEENFLLSLSYNNGFDDEIESNSSLATHLQVHRLVIRLSGQSVSKYAPLEKRKTRHLRSLALILDEYEGRVMQTMISQLNQFKMLRVLAIEGFSSAPDNIIHGLLDHWNLPKAVGKLFHLRYLSLRGSCFLFLPSSIGNLQHLQTLDLRSEVIGRIPNVLWKLRQLRYLYLPNDYFEDDINTKLRFCLKLRLKGLNKLEILENVSTSFCCIEDIFMLNNLRTLSAMINTSKLEHLPGVVGQIFSFSNLQKLKVIGPIGNLPKYEGHFGSCLIDLTLAFSNIREDPMETLEMLPNLRSLHLLDCFKGKEMRCTRSGFRQLEFLSLGILDNLEKWWVDEGAMHNLSRLRISDCRKLEILPVGLTFITTLQELEIYSMSEEFTDRIQVVDGKKGTDFDKVSHIPSIIIRSLTRHFVDWNHLF